ncbi:hypothetical protein QRD40_10610 [Comamonas sp. Y6]|uniref:Uncharacterized protein n=1 Tax=Comamonas resistens TaxID=3046670 RepID=A0ABY8SVQ5_9BURK|nr:hypothetical protein [Comamonas resistens]MDL5036797.1 hypothetical protein [Comamonas resistens]WHS67107.1 hypothetical protein QMY55_08325 [Comamonas resistens]
MTQQAQAEALQTQQFLIARRSHLGSRKSMCDDNGKAAWDKYTAAADLIARQAGRIAELERTTQTVEIPNQPGLNIDLARMREAALHAQVHGAVFKANGSQVRQVLDYLHERTFEIKRLHARVQELERWQEDVRSNSPLLARLERAEQRVKELEVERDAAKGALSGLAKRKDDWKWRAMEAEAQLKAQQAAVQMPEPWGYLIEGRIFIGRLLPKHVNSMVESEGLQPTKLYTEQQVRTMLAAAPTPPAQERKPLTDEQILDVLQLTNPKPSGLVVRLVRAIERAHGIQEKPNAPPI